MGTSRAILEQLGIAFGLYAAFLYWGYLQEELSSLKFTLEGASKPSKFNNIFVLQLFQAIPSLILSVIVTSVAFVAAGKSGVPKGSFLSAETAKKQDDNYRSKMWATAITGTIGPQFGYASMQHLSFPSVLTVKMCKMIPVIIVGMLWHRIKYGYMKVLNAFCITCGVVGFVVLAKQKHDSSAGPSNSWFGVALCVVNIIFDGYLNSTQGLVMKSYGTGPFLMMRHMAIVSIKLIVIILCGVEVLFHVVAMSGGRGADMLSGLTLLGIKPEIQSTLVIFQQVPEVPVLLIKMGILNALGQCFIFAGISRFGAVTLVALTLTRKVGSVFISIFYHGHDMMFVQWISLAVVVAGVIFDCWMGIDEHKKKAASTAAAGEKTVSSSKKGNRPDPKAPVPSGPGSPTISRKYVNK